MLETRFSGPDAISGHSSRQVSRFTKPLSVWVYFFYGTGLPDHWETDDPFCTSTFFLFSDMSDARRRQPASWELARVIKRDMMLICMARHWHLAFRYGGSAAFLLSFILGFIGVHGAREIIPQVDDEGKDSLPAGVIRLNQRQLGEIGLWIA